MPRTHADEFKGSRRFSIQRRLGAGAVGVVYEAYDRERHEQVALKTLRYLDPAAIYRLKHEFRSLADIAHRNLVALHELISEGDQWFFTMELIDGKDFLSHVRADPTSAFADTVQFDGSIDPLNDTIDADRYDDVMTPPPLSLAQYTQLREALRQLAEGLSALHAARTLHRDIKPSNVLIRRDGRVVLLDFGLATELDQESLRQTVAARPVGTIGYMSPEQAAGMPLTEASDWYSVGVMLYAALTGRLPFRGPVLAVISEKQRADPPPPGEVVSEVPEDLNEICMQLLQRNPEARPNGAEVLRRLGSIQEEPDSFILTATSHPRDAPFVGRERQFQELDEAFVAMQDGHTVCVCLRGKSGVGKSALVSRFVDGLSERGDAVVLAGRCYERESVPYKALDSLVDALSRHLVGMSRLQAEALLPRDALALARVFPVLRRVEAIASTPRRSVEIPDQHELRRRAFAALRELLARMGDRSPLVLFIDDLQWGDVDSVDLLTELLRPPDPPVLLLLACYRREDEDNSPFLHSFLAARHKLSASVDWRAMDLDELTTDEARDLALTLLGPRVPAAKKLASWVANESGGNPYFVAELLRHVRAGDQQPARPVATHELTLDEVLQSRIQLLAENARRLLETIAVASQPIPQQVAFRAAELDRDQRSTIAMLRTSHFVRTTGPDDQDEVETYHDRIRETVLAHLSPGALLDHHRNLAFALEASGTADADELAIHFEGANMPDRAGEHYAVAAAQAADALAFDRAAALYQKALQLHSGSDEEKRTLRRQYGDVLANAGRGPQAAQIYRSAADGADSADRLELQRRASMQLLISGHIDEGLSSLRSVLGTVGMQLAPTPTRAFLSLLYRRARLRLRGLKFRERDTSQIAAADLTRIDICWSAAVGLSIVDTVRGADFQTRNLLLSLDAGEPYRIARSLAWEAAHVSNAGQPAKPRTDKLLAVARSLAERINHPHALGLAALSSGIQAYMLGRWKEGRDLSQRAYEIFRDRCTGVAWELDTAQSFVLWSLFFLGEVAELSRRLPLVLQEAQDRGDLYAVTNTGTFVGYLTWLVNDNPKGARKHLREVMREWSHQGFHVQHLTGLMGQVQIELYSGDGPAAHELLLEQWPEVRRSFFLHVQTVRIFMHYLRARTALAAAEQTSNWQPLVRSARRDARRIERERTSWSQPFAQMLSGAVAAAYGDRQRAHSLLSSAVRGFDSADMSLFAASARRRLGQLLGGEKGAALIDEANRWMAAQNIKNPDRMTDQHAPSFIKLVK